jgi:hypothetical protein
VSANKCAIPSTDYCNSPPDNDARRLKTSRVAGHNTVTPGLNTNATGARPISRGEADAVCSTQTPGGQIGSSVCHTRRVAGAVPAVLQLPGRALISSAVPPLACGCRAAVLHHLSPLPPPSNPVPLPSLSRAELPADYAGAYHVSSLARGSILEPDNGVFLFLCAGCRRWRGGRRMRTGGRWCAEVCVACPSCLFLLEDICRDQPSALVVGSCWDRPSAFAGIDRRLLLGSIVGFCWDRPQAAR